MAEATTSSGKRNAENMDTDTGGIDPETKRPCFPPVAAEKLAGKTEFRRIPVQTNRRTPLQQNWEKIFTPVVEQLKLQIRYNLRNRSVELRTSQETKASNAIQKGADFVKAFLLGFDVNDALAIVRLDDLFVESFDVKDVKMLKGDHLGRAIGRLAGKGGKTKFSIENATKTRIVLADSKVHILGSYQSIQIARRAICALIMGSPPAKVYGKLRAIQSSASSRI
ncbi:RNA-binding protein PNO1-like [Littorina saxatilis]|uniref:K Homology domain-containing protein n=1 Tax=Littorina saxatilis TaxID=31220 RepID=A0AAN9BE19_9CAEN